jgi:uncharacterized protein YeaO (DUF488 family)
MPKLTAKRVYDSKDKEDGQRVLVDRIWPRGIRKADLGDALWLKDVAPSTPLRKWFGHRPERWKEFCKRYWAELKRSKEPVETLRGLLRKGHVTLLYSAHDSEHNQAVALMEYLKR